MNPVYGIGLRVPHYRTFLDEHPEVQLLEVHSENFFNDGGWDLRVLAELMPHYAFSFHGVGMGIGSAYAEHFDGHLEQLAHLCQRFEPELVSEHLCWCAVPGRHFNDLLPLSFTNEVLNLVCERVDKIQTRLNRQILVENVSTSLRFEQSEFSEIELLNELAKRSGCGILLDINNLYVNERNHGESALEALMQVSLEAVGEIHLAGHLETDLAVIDDHGSTVADSVWTLFETFVEHHGEVPTVVEWDTDIPELDVLLGEMKTARERAKRVVSSRETASNL